MAIHVERSVQINRSVEDVFAFVSDCRNDPRWCKRVLECEQVEGDGPGAGARYRIVHRPQRLRSAMELDVRVETFDPPHRMTMVERDKDGTFAVTYDLRAERGGTSITQRDDITLAGVPRILRPIGRLVIGRHLSEQFGALKSLLEQEA
jgi:uncharacterized protein YndB with AHSA1/START domain